MTTRQKFGNGVIMINQATEKAGIFQQGPCIDIVGVTGSIPVAPTTSFSVLKMTMA